METKEVPLMRKYIRGIGAATGVAGQFIHQCATEAPPQLRTSLERDLARLGTLLSVIGATILIVDAILPGGGRD